MARQPSPGLGAGVLPELSSTTWISRDVTFEAVEKAQELLMPVAPHARADDRAVEKVGAANEVVVPFGRRRASLCWRIHASPASRTGYRPEPGSNFSHQTESTNLGGKLRLAAQLKSNLRRIGDPADSGCEGSPDRDRAPSFARKEHVGWFASASFGRDHGLRRTVGVVGASCAPRQAVPAQIAHRLVSGIRNPYRGQLAGPVQLCQAGGIATIRLDPVARSLRDQRRGDHDALVPARPVVRRTFGLKSYFRSTQTLLSESGVLIEEALLNELLNEFITFQQSLLFI
jgi:hypothetical protein